MAKRTHDDPLPDAKRMCALPRLPIDVWGEISARCDAKTRQALALTCIDFARELRKPCRVEEAKKRLSRVSISTQPGFGTEVRFRQEELPNGQAHGWYTEYSTPDKSPTATFLVARTYFRDGERNGLHERFHTNGILYKRCHYLNGQKCGTETWYSPQGRTYQCTWAHGRRHGVEYSWEDGGVCLYTRRKWSGGVLHGFDVTYSNNGLHPNLRNHWINGNRCPGCSVCNSVNAEQLARL